jgi:hypothetical protein
MKLKLYFSNGRKGNDNWGTNIQLESGALQIIEILEELLSKIRKEIAEPKKAEGKGK